MTRRVDDKLHSEAPTVVIEAAAGHGKTTRAAEYAREAAERLKAGKVLLLSHTHAACGEFHRKCGGDYRRKIDVETCDSFCLKVIAPYAHPLGLPMPLEAHIGRTANGVRFEDLSKRAADLFTRAPTVARAVATHYPIIVLDEHQDASLSQHETASVLQKSGGARLRIFGDSMQAIHAKNKESYVDFPRLWADAHERDSLDEPHRWSETRDLGEWILDCRSRLKAGNPISLRSAPPAVMVATHGQFAGRQKFIERKGATKVIHRFLDDTSHSGVILAFSGAMVKSIAEMSGWRVKVNEGAQLDELDTLIDAMDTYAGSPRDLCSAFLNFLGTIGAGASAERASLAGRLGVTVNARGVGRRQEVWLKHFEPIYLSPDHRGIAAAMRSIQTSPPAGYSIRLRDHSWALSSFSRMDDPHAFRSTLGRIRRQWKPRAQMVSTIHKAKGLDFDNVLLCPVDKHQYPAGELGAKLLYVALSRAKQAIRLIVETKTATPHVSVT